MRLSQVIVLLSFFSLVSGAIGLIIWDYNNFLSLLFIGVILSFLAIAMDWMEENGL